MARIRAKKFKVTSIYFLNNLDFNIDMTYEWNYIIKVQVNHELNIIQAVLDIEFAILEDMNLTSSKSSFLLLSKNGKYIKIIN